MKIWTGFPEHQLDNDDWAELCSATATAEGGSKWIPIADLLCGKCSALDLDMVCWWWWYSVAQCKVFTFEIFLTLLPHWHWHWLWCYTIIILVHSFTREKSSHRTQTAITILNTTAGDPPPSSLWCREGAGQWSTSFIIDEFALGERVASF